MATPSKITKPYGSWTSPITADLVSSAEKRAGDMVLAGDGRLLWIETRPDENGRAVLVKEMDSKGVDVLPSDFSCQTLVHEYGGGAFAVNGDTIIFSNNNDQRLYKHIIGAENLPFPITPDYGGSLVRYADGAFDPHFSRYVTVMEDHRESSSNPIATIAAIGIKDAGKQEPKQLISGSDFYASPRIDPSQKRMAWIEWHHPNMPWDQAELWVGYFDENGDLSTRVLVAGGDAGVTESPTEPKWSAKGELIFITDRNNGYWNIYKWIEENNEAVVVYSLNAEFTRPLWVLGISSYDFLEKDNNNHELVCSYREQGRSYLGILDYYKGSLSLLDVPFTDIGNIVSGLGCFYVEGASATHPLSIAKVTLDGTRRKVLDFSTIWSSSPDLTKYGSYFSLPEVIEFPTVCPGQSAYAYFYLPSNAMYQASMDEKPPLLVENHGGPTYLARGILDLNIQYWTSRGWAFVDVNYGGSTGYGREYRERLNGKWGIVDVNDCCSCVKFLVESGKVDAERLCITGKSAGGFSTLACLAFTETFKAGASLFGVADLSLMKAETHKYESHYFDNLIGDEQALYERSPINSVDKFTCPVILFQGLEDKIVTPDQARKIYKTLKEKGLPVALVEFEGEQHGFRKAKNIKFCLEQQLVFFARLVGHFEVADEICPIKIDNFDS